MRHYLVALIDTACAAYLMRIFKSIILRMKHTKDGKCEREKRRSEHADAKAPLLAGGFAGVSVDIALFPLDTIKTRAQSAAGFRAAGGFAGVYNGLLSAAQ